MTRDEALKIYQEQGTQAAAKAAGVSARSITSWAKQAGITSQVAAKRTEDARRAANRVTQTWSDFREREALAAGAAANRVRQEIISRVENGVSGGDIRGIAIAYGILVDKAEVLSNQATQRIELWAESELDIELRKLITEMESHDESG